ncbi:MAG: polysaccharide deacetylase family protein [Candidatus Omnitrophica bacterium]|nr:polysaccharide deacetylase family protein [Candidatus Omnitrophota bacterium]
MSGRYCAIQVDLDGLWVIEKLSGRSVPLETDPVFYDGTERLLRLFEEFGVKATFFVVAKDLESGNKLNLVRRIISSGHEIASHGMSHGYITMLDDDEARREIAGSKEAIDNALGLKIAGFKAAGFAARREVVPFLEEAGYRYDSSVLPTSLGPVMEAVLKVRYRKWGMATAPRGPYVPARKDIFRRGESAIVELPVTTMPLLRFPAHFSYASAMGLTYASITRPHKFSRYVTYLFHPLDLVDRAAMVGGKVLPKTRISFDGRVALARAMLEHFVTGFNIVTSREMAQIVRSKHAAA